MNRLIFSRKSNSTFSNANGCMQCLNANLPKTALNQSTQMNNMSPPHAKRRMGGGIAATICKKRTTITIVAIMIETEALRNL